MKTSYTKKDLINDIAKEQTEISKADIANTIELAAKYLLYRVKNGDKISFVKTFNAFVRRVAAKKGRNPKTGEVINIPARNKVFVKIAKELTKEVQN